MPSPALIGPDLTQEARARATRPPAAPGPEEIPLGSSPRLATLLGAGCPDRATVDALWAEADASGTPLVETAPDPAQRLLTFLWRGGDDVTSVILFANKRFDRAHPERTALRRIDGTEVWHLTLQVPADWQASYQLLVNGEGPAPDPRNPNTTRQGTTVKSVVDLAGSFVSAARIEGPAAIAHRLVGPLGPVEVWTVDPSGAASDSAEVIVLDGRMWLEELDLVPRLQAAMAHGEIPPVRLVLVDTGTEAQRTQLLSCSNDMASFLAHDIAGLADAVFGAPPTGGRYLAGSSLSGLQAVFSALSRPEVFTGALAQSGSFWWPSADLDSEWLSRSVPAGAQRFCVQDGSDEWVNTEPTANLLAALRTAGHQVRDTTVSGGHDRVWWAARFAEGVADLLGA